MTALKKWWERWVMLSMVAMLLIGSYLIVGGLIFRQWHDVLIGSLPWLMSIPYWQSKRERGMRRE